MRKLQPYEQRFLAEYYQLDDRIVKLRAMLGDWDNLDFEPKCPYELLRDQYDTMYRYKAILELRADIEEVML